MLHRPRRSRGISPTGARSAARTEANCGALKEGSRIFSSYRVGEQKVWVITEADRSVTTVLLPEDY